MNITSNMLDFGNESIRFVLEYIKERQERKILSLSYKINLKDISECEDIVNKIKKHHFIIDEIDEILCDDYHPFWDEYYEQYEEDEEQEINE